MKRRLRVKNLEARITKLEALVMLNYTSWLNRDVEVQHEMYRVQEQVRRAREHRLKDKYGY